MKIPFTNIQVTRNEQIGTGLFAVAGWTAFSAAFSSAPLLATLIAIPGVTAAAVGAVKLAQATYKFAYETAEDYADAHPEGKVAKFLAYAPTLDLDEADEHEMDLDEGEEFTAEERDGLFADYANVAAGSYNQRTLLNLREREEQKQMPALNRAEIDGMAYGSSRSGFVRNRF